MFDKQTGKLIACITENLPSMGSGVMQRLIENPIILKRFLMDLGCGIDSSVSAIESIVSFDRPPLIIPPHCVLSEDKQLPNRIRGQVVINRVSAIPRTHLDGGQRIGHYIQGPELYRRLFPLPVYGSQLMEFYLINQCLIPREWKGKAIYFWGTIFGLPDPVRGGILDACVLYMYWDTHKNQWDWQFHWIGNNFIDDKQCAAIASI